MTASFPNARQLKHGQIYWVDFNPSQGAEIQKIRPALILQDHDVAGSSRTVVLCPITTSSKPHPFDVPIKHPELNPGSAIRVIQIKSVDVKRVKSLIGRANQAILIRVFEQLDLLLGRT